MGSEPCVYEISSSSDEDEDGILLVKASGLPGSHERNNVSLNSNDDNDVVVIEKVHCPEARIVEKRPAVDNSSFLSGTETFLARKTGEDDCCILDLVPEKNVLAVDSKSNDTDDLVVTGESGPVACRDYPHARYLCAKFPFKSTAHESFCEQCHCYVCDTLAPCIFWFLGKESSDHCHAYDKDEKWKVLRNCLKPQSLPLRAPVSHPLSSRQSRLRNHPVSSSQQPLSGMVIASSTISSSTCNIYPDPDLFFDVSSSLPLYLRPYAPSTTNITTGSDAYSDSMGFPAMVPVTVDSSSARARNLNHSVPVNRPRVIKRFKNRLTNQSRWLNVTSGSRRQGLNLPMSLLPNMADERRLLSTANPESWIRDAMLENNTQGHLNRHGNFPQQMHSMSRVHTRVSEPSPANVLRDSRERLGQLSHRGGIQSVPKTHNYLSPGQRDILQDDIIGARSLQWEHENVTQTSESTATVPLQTVSSQIAFNEQSRAQTQRKANVEQSVEINNIMDTNVANEVALDCSQQEIVIQEIAGGQDVDASTTLDDILAQLDCSDFWPDLNLIPY